MSPILDGVHVEDEVEDLGHRSRIDWDDETRIEGLTTLKDIGILILELGSR